DYWPVTNSLLWLEWRLWGKEPTNYHRINILLQIINSLLIWAGLRRLAIPGAFLAALLYAVHPLNVETGAWIFQRKNMLSALFFLASLWCYLGDRVGISATAGGAALSAGRRPQQLRRAAARWYWLSFAAFVSAMLSKGSVAFLPALLLVIQWWRKGRLERSDFVRTAPFWVAAMGLTMVNIWFQTHNSGVAIRDVTGLQRLLGAAAAVWFYLEKALVPWGLSFVYPQWD